MIYWTLLGFAVAIGLIVALSPVWPARSDSDDGPFTVAGGSEGSGACGDGGGGGGDGGSCD